MLVGVERQKQRFSENLSRFAAGLPSNHALLWGVRGTGKSSLAKAAFMAMTDAHPSLRLVELDRDHIARVCPNCSHVCADARNGSVLCDDLSFEDGAGRPKR